MVRERNIDNYLIVFLLFTITIKTTLSFMIAFSLLILWILEKNYKETFKTIVSDKLALSFIALFMVHLLGLAWTESYEEGLKILSKQKTYLFSPLLIAFMDRRFATLALHAFLAAMLLSEFYSFYLYISHDINILGSLPSPFMHHMHYSLILAFTFGYLVTKIDFKHIVQKTNLFYLFFALFTLLILFINKGRIGQIAILLVFFILAVGKFRLSIVKSTLTVALLSITLFVAAYNFSEQFKTRIDKASYEFTHVVGTDKRDSIACRFEMWDYATQIGTSNPLIGIGTGDSISEMNHLLGKDAFQKLFNECGLGMKYQFNPHNNFVLYYMQFGIIGLITLILVLLMQFKIALNQNSLPMIILLSVTVVGMMTTSLISIHIKYMFFYAFVLTMLYLESLETKT